jgi:hypothetical protein
MMTASRFLPSLRRGLLATMLAALAACSTAASPPPDVTASAAATDASAQLRALLGNAACSDDSQCRTVGWGAKACGGPERWIAYSATRTDGAALEQLARQHAEQQRASQARAGIVSNCMYVPDPGAQCVASRCVLRDRRAVAQ